MQRVSLMLVLLLVAATALVGASATSASSGEKIKNTAELLPCFQAEEDDAGGKAKWEQKQGTGEPAPVQVKVEVWGLPAGADELEVVVRFEEGDVDRPIGLGRLFVDRVELSGHLSTTLDWGKPLPPPEDGPFFEVVDSRTLRTLYVTNPVDC